MKRNLKRIGITALIIGATIVVVNLLATLIGPVAVLISIPAGMGCFLVWDN